jgi:hypothetical protein
MTVGLAGPRAASHLIRDRTELARAVTARVYEESPELLERHGERGREKCLQDMHYNIDHLISAVDLEQPDMFAQYVVWLDSMLRSRGVATRDVKRCFELLRDEVVARYDAPEAGTIAAVLDQGIAVVAGE